MWPRIRDWPYHIEACVVTVIVALLVVFPLCIWNTWVRTEAREAIVGGKTWERSIELEMFRAIQDERWYSAPSDAYNVDREWEYHHTDRIKVGEVSCGKDCTMPIYVYDDVYEWRYYYTVDRWVTSRWMLSRGNEIAPFWPELPATLVDLPVLGNEREGNERRDDYKLSVSCVDGECDTTLTLEFGTWNKYSNGERVIAHVNSRGKVRGIDEHT